MCIDSKRLLFRVYEWTTLFWTQAQYEQRIGLYSVINQTCRGEKQKGLQLYTGKLICHQVIYSITASQSYATISINHIKSKKKNLQIHENRNAGKPEVTFMLVGNVTNVQ